MTDYDKLTLEVWTNGAISPQDAIGLAAKLLKDHMAIFINFEELPERPKRFGRTRRLTRQRSPEPLRGGTRTQRPLLQLPQERQHPDHRRSGPEDRSRNAAHQELRPQVAQRDQGDPRRPRPRLRHARRRSRGTSSVPAGAPPTWRSRRRRRQDPASRSPSHPETTDET
jgi:hypothetical protein